MRVTVHLADGGTLDVGHFDVASALDLCESVEGGEPWLTFEMDDDTALVNAAHVVRIDFETGR
ncbi:hypothetical protein [uncultured Aeromicrobium sp.]|uniref:hypothetical protein n=1 Tax=uncultured Aeromicrobium sp. TaxID=337820 RepID=UPI0025E79695|nr:hypothetical protein [uncultured Aeromicrobium sp.]